jgi:hypothetical protein
MSGGCGALKSRLNCGKRRICGTSLHVPSAHMVNIATQCVNA